MKPAAAPPSAQEIVVKILVRKLIALVALGGCAAFAVGGLLLLGWATRQFDTPEQAAFRVAVSQVLANSGQVAFGNDHQAEGLARRFGQRIEAMREVAFSGAKEEKERASLTKGRFLVHCQLQGDQACFLVHVPQLKNYEGEVRETLLELAWVAAQNATREAGVRRLGVGLRGVALFGAIAVGEVGQERPALFECAPSLDTAPLLPFYAPQATVSPAATAAAPGE